MLRSIAAFGLIALLFSNVFLKSAILLDFKLHQQVISETICVQKDLKQNTCNGKCHLSKQLQKSEDDAEDAPVIPKVLLEIILFFDAIETPQFEQFACFHLLIPHVSELRGIRVYTSIFHPPLSVLS